MTYWITVHFWDDPTDEYMGYDQELEADSVQEVLDWLWEHESKKAVEAFTIYKGPMGESYDEVYNSKDGLIHE